MEQAGNGASSASEPGFGDSRALGEHGRRIQHDAEALATTFRDAGDGVQRYLTAQVEKRPLITLGMAAGAGYILGGGLSLRLTAFLLGAMTRLGTALVARELGSRLLQGGPPMDHHQTTPENSSGLHEE